MSTRPSCRPRRCPRPIRRSQFTVVYDDEHVIVVDKPAGLVVHPGAGNPTGTLVNGLLVDYPELAGIGESHRPGIVHRLDIGTSGSDGGRAIRSGLPLVGVRAGPARRRQGVSHAGVGTPGQSQRRHRRADRPRPPRPDADGGRRRRQVGAHPVSGAGWPTTSRPRRARWNAGWSRAARTRSGSTSPPSGTRWSATAPTAGSVTRITTPRPFLHAAELAFVHPSSNEPMSFTSPLPDDLAAVEAQLTT